MPDTLMAGTVIDECGYLLRPRAALSKSSSSMIASDQQNLLTLARQEVLGHAPIVLTPPDDPALRD